MKPLRARLLSSSVMQRCIGGGIVAGGALALAACSNPYAAPTAGSAVAPAGLEQPASSPAPDGGRTMLAANPCNPCAATNPCAAASPCAAANPCAAADPCSPCAPAAGPASECEVPRLVQEAAANPCAASPCAAANPCAANPCAPCSPCAPGEAVELTPEEAEAAYECIKDVMQAAYTGGLQQAAAGPCNPCAAASPCNPCAAASPCNPCAAVNPCNPCAAVNPCAAAGPCSPCNPCAVIKPANPCNPCAAASPCNPCAAANPCNPCAAANPCNPCAASPCGPQAAAAVPDEVASVAESYLDWTRVNTVPYVSATHGSRYVNNYPGPEAAEAYQRYEDVGTMPAGGRIAKDSFTVSPAGEAAVGPLFVMEKMPDGFNAASADWRYAMIMPDGSLFGVTGGQGSEQVEFCAECHAAVADVQDSLFFLPEEFRVTSR